MSSNLYIVPHDFTEVGDAALKYALHLGKHVQAKIQILHLISDKSGLIAAKTKLEKLVNNQEVPHGVELTYIIRIGNIFDSIAKVAKEEHAQLIIMGTHGARGFQKLFGSHAMKVITSVDIPFLVVQKDTVMEEIEHILVPIDLTKESLQIVNIAGDMANIFKAQVHVIGEKQNDEILNQQMKNRILIVKNQYEERKIPCTVEFIKDSGSYNRKIVNYSKKNSIDLIAFAYHSESLMPQFDNFAQNLITNELQLPCMVINSKLASALYF